jgi:death on curing protein
VAQTPPIHYLTPDDVWAMNDAILRREGAQSLVRDRGALESAVVRPQTAAYYDHSDLVAQTAALITGIALAHPFLDGNKRTAAIAGATFLRLNGCRITSADDTFGRQIVAVVNRAGDLGTATQQLTGWLRTVVTPAS